MFDFTFLFDMNIFFLSLFKSKIMINETKKILRKNRKKRAFFFKFEFELMDCFIADEKVNSVFNKTLKNPLTKENKISGENQNVN